MRGLWVVLFGLVPIFGVGAFVLAGVTPGAWLPENVTSELGYGLDIDRLFYVILGITAFFFVVTEVLLVYAMLTGKGRDNGKASYVHGNHVLEIGWTIMTAAILVFLAFYQIPTWAKAKYKSERPKKPPDALITASQFLWEVRYPAWDDTASPPGPRVLDTLNPSLQDSFEIINELHMPPGEQFLIHLTSRDVIHSFWLPNLRIKQDALPGNIIPVWFEAKKPGTYSWECAELCGWGHYRMRAKLIVHKNRAEYEDWLKEKTREQTHGKPATK